MKMVSTFEDIGYDNDIHVVLWPELDQKLHNSTHEFIRTAVKRPMYCRHCKTLMWNLRRCYYRCSKCKMCVHEKCIDLFNSTHSNRSCISKVGAVSRCSTIAKFNSSRNLNARIQSDSGRNYRSYTERGYNRNEKIHSEPAFEQPNKGLLFLEHGLKNIKLNENECSGTYIYVDGFTSRQVDFALIAPTAELKLIFENGQQICIPEQSQAEVNKVSRTWRTIGIPNLATPNDIDFICQTIRAGLENLKFKRGIKSSFRLTEKHPNHDFDDIFEVDTKNLLGAGRFGKVYCGHNRETKQAVAIKIIHATKASDQLSSADHEADLLFDLKYPGVLKCEGIFYRSDSVIIVTEKMDYDMLFYILRSENPKGRLAEDITKYFCFQLSSAIRYLHSKDIAHCDLKPENVLLKIYPEDVIQTKIADFGHAKIIRDGSVRHTLVGTLAYLAPEAFNSDLRKHHGYNRSLDIWSFGVIAYVSLCGYFPYREDIDLVQQVIANDNIFASKVWDEISPAAKGYISEKLLVPDAGRRTNSQSLIYHEWFTKDKALLRSLKILEEKVGMQWLTDEFQESPAETSDSECDTE